MTGRIFRSAFLTGVLVMLLSCTLILTGLYRYHENQVFRRLAVETDYVIHGLELMGEDYLTALRPEERLTWIAEGMAMIGTPADKMNKDAKIKLLAFLDDRGVFLIQKSGQKVCELLGISKFTLYNYLEEVRKGK